MTAETPPDPVAFELSALCHAGRDSLGTETRPPVAPVRALERLAALGLHSVALADSDLVPIDATPAERERILKDFESACRNHGSRVVALAANLWQDPAFKDGALASPSARVRSLALARTTAALDLALALGVETFVLCSPRDGGLGSSAVDPGVVWRRLGEALEVILDHAGRLRSRPRVALTVRPAPARPAGCLASAGAALALVEGRGPAGALGIGLSTACELQAGLDPVWVASLALSTGRLAHVELSDGVDGAPFGSERIKEAFHLLCSLEASGWRGCPVLCGRPGRAEEPEGLWDQARGAARTYWALREKARKFLADPEVRELRGRLEEEGAGAVAGTTPTGGAWPDRRALGQRRLRIERLERIVIDLLLGVR